MINYLSDDLRPWEDEDPTDAPFEIPPEDKPLWEESRNIDEVKREELLRRILAQDRAFGFIDGCVVDKQMARSILLIYDGLTKPKNKLKLMQSDIAVQIYYVNKAVDDGILVWTINRR